MEVNYTLGQLEQYADKLRLAQQQSVEAVLRAADTIYAARLETKELQMKLDDTLNAIDVLRGDEY